ncbi:hypothetical protein [Streptomyces hydrogenans]|uniref:hypothetical protein n=1 Tax=Streptomyces hydrogenans TaxID=1873719 RepID=UPI00332962AD
MNGSEADRLVLNVEDAAEVYIEVRYPDGRMIDQGRRALRAGLNSLPVPRMGVAAIRNAL